MKKTLYLSICVLLFSMFFSTGANAQLTISGAYITHGCDTNDYYVTNSGYMAGYTLQTYFGDGTNIIVPDDSMAFFSHAYATPGTYTVKYVLIDAGGIRVDSLIATDVVGFCSTISFTPYLDNNSNCLFDAGDNGIYGPCTVEIDSAGVPVYTMTATSIHYNTPLSTPIGTIYSFKLLTPPSGVNVTCPGSGIVYDTLGVSHGARLMGFECGSSSGFDISEIVNVGGPGRHMSIVNVNVSNAFCTAHTGSLTMTFSPKYDLSYAYPTPTSVAGNVITWDFPALSNTAPVFVTAHFDVPGTWLMPGDTIHSSYVLSPTSGDLDPSNNTVVRIDTVKSSYDPNEKSVTPQGTITAGTKLDYKIIFENTGNAPAVNIHVQDTLSDDLDIATFKLVSSSAPVYTSFSQDGAGHTVVKFDFPNINLLDSSHHGQCDGMVTFTINAKPGLAGGTVIDNRAGIYFDDNEVVMTNTATNVIGSTTGAATMSNTPKVTIYPNPVNDQLTIKTDGAYTTLTIANAIGQVVMTRQLDVTSTVLSSSPAKVDVKTLAPGVYYLTLKGTQGVKVVKFEKL